jgi:hypothetical protein
MRLLKLLSLTSAGLRHFSHLAARVPATASPSAKSRSCSARLPPWATTRRPTFDAIALSRYPMYAKMLGRRIQGVDHLLWDRVVCSVARHVIMTKFRAIPWLASLLLGTNDAVLAEATRYDTVWGIGLDTLTTATSRRFGVGAAPTCSAPAGHS